jgi:hypothetical protein
MVNDFPLYMHDIWIVNLTDKLAWYLKHKDANIMTEPKI